jgi:hypothetical protein
VVSGVGGGIYRAGRSEGKGITRVHDRVDDISA